MRKSNGKVRRTAAEWRDVLTSFERSGLTRAAFCEQEGISLASFSAWKKRILSELPKSEGFIELSSAKPQRSSSDAELVFPSGLILRIRG